MSIGYILIAIIVGIIVFLRIVIFSNWKRYKFEEIIYIRHEFLISLAQSVWAVEYSDNFSTEG